MKNLLELLKANNGLGKSYYSPTFGEVILDEDNGKLVFTDADDNLGECPDYVKTLYDDGKWSPDGELMVFPSKDQRDWDVWAAQQAQNIYYVGAYVKYNGNDKKLTNSQWRIADIQNSETGLIYHLNSAGASFKTLEVTAEEFKDFVKVKTFDATELKTFDKMLVRSKYQGALWHTAHLDYILDGKAIAYNSTWCYIVPFNKETENFPGTTTNIPEFYSTLCEFVEHF